MKIQSFHKKDAQSPDAHGDASVCPLQRRILRDTAGLLAALCVIFVLLISAIEVVCYADPSYFLREYKKYDVLEALPEMKLEGPDSLMTVTEHMMKYLRGDRDTPELQIEVSMGGEKRGFFTEREILHMADVRNLFVGAQKLRAAAILLTAVLLIGMRVFLCRSTRSFARLVCRSMLRGTVLFLCIAAVFGIIFATDFTGAFITFHHLFFSNDLWILDPSVDMLINIVPEGFFFDTAVRILGMFAAVLIAICAFCIWQLRRLKAGSARV